MSFRDKTPKERIEYCIQELLKRGTKYPGMLRTRRTRDTTSNQAYYTKLAVEAYPELSQEDIDALSKKRTTFKSSGHVVEWTRFLETFKQLNDEIKAKQDQKNIGAGQDQYAVLISEIRKNIEDFILEQYQKIDADIKKSKIFITDKNNTMSREDFQKTYGKQMSSRHGDYYSMDIFYNSKLGILLRLPENQLPEFITKAQENYREKEYHKINSLVYKLKQRFPNLTNIKITNFSKSIDGVEFYLTADSPEGQVKISTSTIYAGGYNIQRLHLRWLMHVYTPDGKDTKIEQ